MKKDRKKIYEYKYFEIITVFFSLFAAVVIAIIGYWHGGFTPKEGLLAVAGGLFIFAITRGAPELMFRKQYRREEKHFNQLFGQAATHGNTILLFAHRAESNGKPLPIDPATIFHNPVDDLSSRVLADRIKPCLNDIEKASNTWPDSSVLQSAAPVAEGVNLWVPMQDFRGANHVASEIARITKKTSQFRTDRSMSDLGYDEIFSTVISFGLGFNRFTHILSELTEKQLFQSYWGPSMRGADLCGHLTDNFCICTKLFFEHVKSLKDEDPFDFSLVARIAAPYSITKGSRYFFICAGRTASGTAAAGYYLANSWKEIHYLYKKNNRDLDKHSLAILIKHRYGGSKSTQTSQNDLDASAEICLSTNGEPIIHWWPS